MNNIKINKLDVNECNLFGDAVSSVREFMKEDSATLTAVKERIEEVKQELVVMQQQPDSKQYLRCLSLSYVSSTKTLRFCPGVDC